MAMGLWSFAVVGGQLIGFPMLSVTKRSYHLCTKPCVANIYYVMGSFSLIRLIDRKILHS